MWFYNDELLIMLGTLTLAPRIINFAVAEIFFSLSTPSLSAHKNLMTRVIKFP